MPASRDDAHARDRRGGCTDGSDWHRARFEGFENGRQLALDWLLLPTITARQYEHGNIDWIELSESSGRLNSETTHRLNGVAGETNNLDAEMAVPAELRKCMCRLPIGEARDR